jgi:hypothetical protein
VPFVTNSLSGIFETEGDEIFINVTGRPFDRPIGRWYEPWHHPGVPAGDVSLAIDSEGRDPQTPPQEWGGGTRFAEQPMRTTAPPEFQKMVKSVFDEQRPVNRSITAGFPPEDDWYEDISTVNKENTVVEINGLGEMGAAKRRGLWAALKAAIYRKRHPRRERWMRDRDKAKKEKEAEPVKSPKEIAAKAISIATVSVAHNQGITPEQVGDQPLMFQRVAWAARRALEKELQRIKRQLKASKQEELIRGAEVTEMVGFPGKIKVVAGVRPAKEIIAEQKEVALNVMVKNEIPPTRENVKAVTKDVQKGWLKKQRKEIVAARREQAKLEAQAASLKKAQLGVTAGVKMSDEWGGTWF